jgi:hypothetical protein
VQYRKHCEENNYPNTRLVLFWALASAFAKAVDDYLISALQKSIKHLALLVIFW